MKIYNLASGSKGNSTYIETKNNKILLDIGMTLKYIKCKLSEIKINPEDIDTIIITHSHKDHTSALGNFIKKYNPKVYITFPMLVENEYLREYKNTIVYEDNIELDECKINSFKISHDCNDTRGFLIEEVKHSLVYITDTGYIKEKYLEKLKNKTAYLIESNHDIEMLINGPYPECLKKRVVSSKGHLSNLETSQYLKKIIGENTENIMLMHLSEKNNTEEKALETIKNNVNNKNILISCAKQDEVSEVKLK